VWKLKTKKNEQENKLDDEDVSNVINTTYILYLLQILEATI